MPLAETRSGRVFAFAWTALATLALLADIGARIGSYEIPSVSAWWLAGIVALSVFVVRRTPRTTFVQPLLILGLLGTCALPFREWRQRVFALPEPLLLTVRSSDGTKNVALERMRLDDRRDLHRLTGHRRGVVLQFTGTFYASRGGSYRFNWRCDDLCALEIGGFRLGPSPAGERRLSLSEGVHRFTFTYEQREGPASMSLAMNRPSFIELLPMEHYLSNEPSAIQKREHEAAAVVVVSFLGFLLAGGLLGRLIESREWLTRDFGRLVRQVLPRLQGPRILGVTTLVASFVATILVWPLGLRITHDDGDWKAVTEGFQLAGEPLALGGGSRAVVHFHGVSGKSGEFRLLVSEASEEAVELRVGTHEQVLVSEASTLRIPWTGAPDIDLDIEARVASPRPGALFLLHEVELDRDLSFGDWLLRSVPLFVAVIVFRLMRRSGQRWQALLGGILGAALSSAALAVVLDAAVLYQHAASTRLSFRIAGLALLWLLLLTHRVGWVSAIAGITGTVGLLYLPALHGGFLTDDFYFARPLSGIELLSTLYDHWDPRHLANDHYRPVIALSLATDYWLWGAHPSGYHLTNLVLQVIGPLLAFGLFMNLGLSSRASLAGSLLLCAHPMSAAPACWTNQRTDGIMAVFFLGSLLLLMGKHFDGKRAVGAIVLGVLALGSKETAVMLPVVSAIAIPIFRPDSRRLRLLTSATLLVAALAYTTYWVHLFPDKARLGAELPSMHTSHPLAAVYPAVFLPPDYGNWWRGMESGFPFWYLAAGWLAWPLLYRAARRFHRGSPASRAVLLGGLWPLVTVLPLFAISGGVDLFRLGLLAAVGFGLTWAGFAEAMEHRRGSLLILAPVALVPWLGREAISSCEAWGPGGFMMTLGTRWKMESAEWQDSIDPDMKRLFLEQIRQRSHAENWVRYGKP